MLRILRETDGGALAVSEDEIVEAQKLLGRIEGIWTAPEAAATLAALMPLRGTGDVGAGARVVLVLTGAGIKSLPPSLTAAIHLEGSPDEVLATVRRAVGA